MSDCSTAAMLPKEPPRTCGTCNELYYAPRCNRLGHVFLDENDEPDDDGMTWADYCLYWKRRDEPTLEQRCQQLEQVARDMWWQIKLSCELEMAGDDSMVGIYREQLEALGVNLDG